MEQDGTAQMTDGALTVSQRLERIEGQLDVMLTLQQEQSSRGRADLLRFEVLDRRVTELEGWMKWGGRLVLALIITAVLGMILVST